MLFIKMMAFSQWHSQSYENAIVSALENNHIGFTPAASNLASLLRKSSQSPSSSEANYLLHRDTFITELSAIKVSVTKRQSRPN
jgi:hypothetical protein